MCGLATDLESFALNMTQKFSQQGPLVSIRTKMIIQDSRVRAGGWDCLVLMQPSLIKTSMSQAWCSEHSKLSWCRLRSNWGSEIWATCPGPCSVYQPNYTSLPSGPSQKDYFLNWNVLPLYITSCFLNWYLPLPLSQITLFKLDLLTGVLCGYISFLRGEIRVNKFSTIHVSVYLGNDYVLRTFLACFLVFFYLTDQFY